MGMYTELVLSTRIKNVPEVVAVLEFMCGQLATKPVTPEHPLFLDDTRWSWMFTCSSYYHVPRSHASFMWDSIGKYWTLIVRSDFKNYDDEITKFVDWIDPYVMSHGDEKTMIGYSRYEEDIEPTILYVKGTEER